MLRFEHLDGAVLRVTGELCRLREPARAIGPGITRLRRRTSCPRHGERARVPRPAFGHFGDPDGPSRPDRQPHIARGPFVVRDTSPWSRPRRGWAVMACPRLGGRGRGESVTPGGGEAREDGTSPGRPAPAIPVSGRRDAGRKRSPGRCIGLDEAEREGAPDGTSPPATAEREANPRAPKPHAPSWMHRSKLPPRGDGRTRRRYA